jgi:hypothetical protein
MDRVVLIVGADMMFNKMSLAISILASQSVRHFFYKNLLHSLIALAQVTRRSGTEFSRVGQCIFLVSGYGT